MRVEKSIQPKSLGIDENDQKKLISTRFLLWETLKCSRWSNKLSLRATIWSWLVVLAEILLLASWKLKTQAHIISWRKIAIFSVSWLFLVVFHWFDSAPGRKDGFFVNSVSFSGTTVSNVDVSIWNYMQWVKERWLKFWTQIRKLFCSLSNKMCKSPWKLGTILNFSEFGKVLKSCFVFALFSIDTIRNLQFEKRFPAMPTFKSPSSIFLKSTNELTLRWRKSCPCFVHRVPETYI